MTGDWQTSEPWCPEPPPERDDDERDRWADRGADRGNALSAAQTARSARWQVYWCRCCAMVWGSDDGAPLCRHGVSPLEDLPFTPLPERMEFLPTWHPFSAPASSAGAPGSSPEEQT